MYIKEFSEKSGFSTDTLRYYEKIGLIDPPLRDSAGRRVYDAADLTWAGFLARLKATGMGIADMPSYARLRAEGDATAAARRDLLVRHRAGMRDQIDVLTANLSVLEDKIVTYEKMIEDAEGTLS